jgi:hypothetical protein
MGNEIGNTRWLSKELMEGKAEDRSLAGRLLGRHGKLSGLNSSLVSASKPGTNYSDRGELKPRLTYFFRGE